MAYATSHLEGLRRPSYKRREPASARASAAARGASRKSDTRPEVVLRKAIWRIGLRYRKNVGNLPGKPDLIFQKARVAVFCDGDFWHGRDWSARRAKLKRGHNGDYWIAKIEANIRRDLKNNALLRDFGWTVVRVWEGDVLARTADVVENIRSVVLKKLAGVESTTLVDKKKK